MSALESLLGTSTAGQLYVDDVFSSISYIGNGTSQTIKNGINLAGGGGMMLIFNNNFSGSGGSASGVFAYDTVNTRSTQFDFSSSAAAVSSPSGKNLVSFNNDGFTIDGTGGYSVNDNGISYTAVAFRKCPKFFDVQTWTGNGAANRTLSHNLNCDIGMIIYKRINGTGDYTVAAKTPAGRSVWAGNSSGTGTGLNKNLAATSENVGTYNSAFTTTTFSVGSSDMLGDINASGVPYVAYIFAHDTSATSMIHTYMFTTGSDGGNPATVLVNQTVNFQPQFVMTGVSSGTNDMFGWNFVDNQRHLSGTLAGVQDNKQSQQLYFSGSAGGAGAGYAVGSHVSTSTTTSEFRLRYYYLDGLTTFFGLVIARSNKPPTTGTDVFKSYASTGNMAITSATINNYKINKPDTLIIANSSNLYWLNKQHYIKNSYDTSVSYYTQTNSTINEANSLDLGYTDPSGGVTTSFGSDINVAYLLKRAAKFYESVSYIGNATSGSKFVHSLKAVPELIIFKHTRKAGGTSNRIMYHKDLGNTKAINLAAGVTSVSTNFFDNTSPTDTNVFIGSNADINSTNFAMADMFATVAGVSYVGSYTGTGAIQNINCGFSNGARFIMIADTNSSTLVDLYLYDTTRGIVVGNDSRLSWILGSIDTTNDDIIPYTAGFGLTAAGGTGLNISGHFYVFLAIA